MSVIVKFPLETLNENVSAYVQLPEKNICDSCTLRSCRSVFVKQTL